MFFFARPLYCGHWLTCSGQNGYSHWRLFFFQVTLPEIRTGSFSQELSCSGARNKFITGAIPRIFKYLTEHLDLPGHSQSVKDKKERRYFPRKQANTTKKHLSITGK